MCEKKFILYSHSCLYVRPYTYNFCLNRHVYEDAELKLEIYKQLEENDCQSIE